MRQVTAALFFIAFLVGGLASSSTSIPEARAQVPAPPNVLVIITDDQRDRTMSQMPATRRIFKEGGTSYPNAFVTTPQCCPSRSSIFSGRYVHNHGVYSNQLAPLFDAEKSWQAELQGAGYKTALYGKYLNDLNEEAPPHWDDYAFRPMGANKYPSGPPGRDLFVGDRAKQFIEQVNSSSISPWAVQLAFKSPHVPYDPERKYEDVPLGKIQRNPGMRESDFSDKNPALRYAQSEKHTPSEVRRGQLRMLYSTDDAIQKVWEAVVASGEADNTLAIFISDNGYYWGEHRLFGKYMPYLESLRVPMYLRYGSEVSSGVDSRFALNIDIAPTIYDAAGITPSYQVDGKSLLDPSWNREWLLFEGARESNHEGWPNWRNAYYDGTQHYIRWENGFREHYNLIKDPYELNSKLSPERADDARRRARRTSKVLEYLLRDAADCVGPIDCP
jgi:arylsulfatase A-like enzyme